MDDVDEHIFGLVLLNDCSARDIQRHEMKPLGPFNAKGFGTVISAWVTPIEAFKASECCRTIEQNPPPLPHLAEPDKAKGTWDVRLKVNVTDRNNKLVHSTTSNLKYLYWTPKQELVHHASAGCGLRTGDLIGTGTLSGPVTFLSQFDQRELTL